ncbi:hypothetical protein [Spirochaeta africana]|uniref:HD/PDEase domain-containing protein n=1 Tax=Spirochaeta africana (strain ATCC 700263 / DSM 8902 / Z-7692) TaxID=889378 RepID=H9UMC0_SPIAZ|nr:hypothetical protein [Spirochaeta africana]AFG38663.1 hypothetical protein Spiaf_2637 [Spirochaeta africana DSM 8902]
MKEFTPEYDSFFVLTPDKTIAEVRRWMGAAYPDMPMTQLERVEQDILALFAGEFPGYRHSTTHYHDLPHTMSVYLATARLLHGAWLAGQGVSMPCAWNGLIGALFHDVGLIQTEDDTSGTGAKYAANHEQRSMKFAADYLARNCEQLPLTDIRIVKKCIACTILSLDPSSIEFPDRETRLVSFAVGAADLYAQMADRAYLEKLLLLYDEFVEAHVPGYKSPLDLLRGTQGFWDHVVSTRIQDKMDNVGDYFIEHFASTIQRRENLYLSSIHQNLAYLQQILEQHAQEYRDMLRRTTEMILN